MSNPTRVEVSLGYTRNMGNYESLRIDVGVQDSVRSDETVAAATERVYNFVETKLVEKIKEVESEVTSAKG